MMREKEIVGAGESCPESQRRGRVSLGKLSEEVNAVGAATLVESEGEQISAVFPVMVRHLHPRVSRCLSWSITPA